MTIKLISFKEPLLLYQWPFGSQAPVFIRKSSSPGKSTDTYNWDGWMDDLRFYVLFNSISVISGR